MTEPLLEIRLLGPMEVVRRDGTVVDGGEWKTGKTTDLLRLLALGDGGAVRVPQLLSRLWPAAAETQARGSLRTAASQLRRALREDCIVRYPGSMQLVGAWVDAVEVRDLLVAWSGDVQAGRTELVVSRARAIERIYRGDFHAYDDHSAWAVAEREVLAQGRLELLADAAEACLRAGAYREALLYANAVLSLDPVAEVALRAKMRAHAELGEPAKALQAFEAYRLRLADDLGSDPTRQTRQLHREIVRHG